MCFFKNNSKKDKKTLVFFSKVSIIYLVAYKTVVILGFFAKRDRKNRERRKTSVIELALTKNHS
jgi:hypothetical protein